MDDLATVESLRVLEGSVGLVLSGLTRLREVGKTGDAAKGAFELAFDNGAKIYFDKGADGDSVVVGEGAWVAAAPENGAAPVKWRRVNQTKRYPTFIGATVRDYSVSLHDDDRTDEVTLYLDETMSIFAYCSTGNLIVITGISSSPIRRHQKARVEYSNPFR